MLEECIYLSCNSAGKKELCTCSHLTFYLVFIVDLFKLFCLSCPFEDNKAVRWERVLINMERAFVGTWAILRPDT